MNIRNLLIVAVLISTAFLYSCKKEEPTPTNDDDSVLPSTFMVDVPPSLTDDTSLKSNKEKSTTLNGNVIYENLTTFIAVGEGAAKMVSDIITAIAVHGINKPMSLSYTSNDDGRTKNLVVVEDATYESITYQFGLTITDANSESNPDNGLALKVFWNNSPVEGVAIINPYNCDKYNNALYEDVLFRIDYSEAGDNGYEKQMEVYITGYPVGSDLYGINNLKMFVGKKGDIVDVYGNSNHPNAKFLTDDVGFCWAFVAAGTDNLGVAEVGIPSNTLNSSDRNEILKTNSIKAVYTNQITTKYPTLDPLLVEAYLVNADAPGYFNNTLGFISAGDAPTTEYGDIVSSMDLLTPYNPSTITSLSISVE